MGKVYRADHPLILHKITVLRNKDTDTKEFRALLEEISTMLVYEATRNLPLEEIAVQTPLVETKGVQISGKKLALVPILRAGLGMVDGAMYIIPNARVGHIGLQRDEATLLPSWYYLKTPEDISQRMILVLDPMLATGGSAVAAIQHLKNMGCKNLRMISVIAAPEGIEKLCREHPDVDIYVGIEDERLDENGYILPGLGDAGDRLFGTQSLRE